MNYEIKTKGEKITSYKAFYDEGESTTSDAVLLDASDEDIAGMVRAIAKDLQTIELKNIPGPTMVSAGSFLLTSVAHHFNADYLESRLTNLTNGTERLGDWATYTFKLPENRISRKIITLLVKFVCWVRGLMT
jgi:hypothetical protein